MVFYWNLRDVSSLGMTLLRANQENKKFAIDWVAGLGSSYEEVREIINEHDDSGDGLMDLEEFVHMMKNQIW